MHSNRRLWIYERTDNEKLASKLDTVDWNALLSDSQDVDELCNTYDHLYQMGLSKHPKKNNV
jgi:hypothetical protein